MWTVALIIIWLIAAVGFYLNRRGTSGIAGNTRSNTETEAWLEGRYGDKRKP